MERVAIVKTRIFWKFFLPYLVIFASLILAAFIIFNNYLQPFVDSAAKKTAITELISIEQNVKDILKNDNSQIAKSKLDKIVNLTNTAITVFDSSQNEVATFQSLSMSSDEEVFVDSKQKTTNLEQASLGEMITSRQNNDQGVMYFSVVKRIDVSDVKFGFVQIIMPLTEYQQQLNSIRNSFLGIVFIGGIIGLYLGYRRSKHFTRPIYEMKQVCSALQTGNYSQRVETISKDELGKLGETLNQLGQEITAKIDTISFERAQLKTIMASMVEGIVSIDDNNTLQFCNSAAYNLLGSDVRDGRGHSIDSLKGFQLLTDLVSKARGTQVLEEEELRIKEGSTMRILECYASTFKTTEDAGMIIVLHNVTKIRHLERVRRDFVANASHEIKTPLTNIKGYAETLLAGALGDKDFSMKFVQKIDANASRLSHLVKDLLSLAKLESQDEGMRIIPTNWSTIVAQGVRRYEDVIGEKNLSVEINESTLADQILGDNDAMAQIFDNLLTNAIRYTPENGKIHISGMKAEKYYILNIEDNGIGISKKNLARVFERFYRVDKARSRELGGTGLGLAIVKHLVTNMNGKVYVTSEVGMGSKFSIALRSPTS